MDKQRPIKVEPEKSEDDIQREQLGPRFAPAAPGPAKMTPQRANMLIRPRGITRYPHCPEKARRGMVVGHGALDRARLASDR
jgi:hypothetical protein